MESRITALERSVRRTRFVAMGLAAALGGITIAGFVRQPQVADEVRAHRFVAVDDAGHVRARLGQDPVTTQRRSRAAGLTVYDSTGAERGGFSTMDDGGVVIGMDAPRGVGAPMPDRIGLMVERDGSSHVMLIDNETRAVAKLQSDGKGGGGVQVFKWNMPAKRVSIRTLTYDGDVRDSVPFGE